MGSEGLGAAYEVPLVAKGLYALGILANASHVLPKAWCAAKRLRPDTELMTIAVAYAIGVTIGVAPSGPGLVLMHNLLSMCYYKTWTHLGAFTRIRVVGGLEE